MFQFEEKRVKRHPPLSSGGFGSIYEYQPKNPNGKQWVVKEIYCKDAAHIESYVQEIVLSFNHNSPFILPSNGFNIVQHQTGKWVIRIKMPRMKGSLRDYITHKSNKPFTQEEIVRLLYRLAYGLKQLQHVNISHRDMKPDNILLDKENNGWIADLGLGRLVVEETEYSQIGLAGTVGYFPPETNGASKIKKKHLHKIDLWNLGVTMYEVCLFHDFYLHKELHDKPLPQQLELIVSKVAKRYGEKFGQILAGLLSIDPEKRISFDTVCQLLEDNFSEHLQSTFDALAGNIRKTHRKIILDRFNIPSESKSLANELQEKEKEAESKARKAFKEGLRFAQNLATQYSKDFIFHFDEELTVKPRDPSNLISSAIENLNKQLSEIINEVPADLVSGLKVDFSWCKSLDENSLKSFNFKDIKDDKMRELTLNLGGCSQITDKDISFLNQDNLGGLRKLESLNVDFSGCQITKDGIEQLFENLSSLPLKQLSIRAHECSEIKLLQSDINEFANKISGIKSLEKLTLDILSDANVSKQARNSLRESLKHINDLEII